MSGERTWAPSAGTALALCAAAALVGAAVRVVPAFGDFWLDEIWTYDSARRLRSATEVFTGIHHSNNNHLNTLLFFVLGERDGWLAYRVPSLVAGIASIPLAAALAWRWGRLEAVFAAVLFASCYALVHFSSEARGYAATVGFALAAAWLLEAELARPRRFLGALFGLCVVLGFLSHLVFLFFYAGALVASGWRLLRDSATRREGAVGLARLHALPLLCLAALWWVDLRWLVVGGGNPTDYAALLARTAGFSLGLPVSLAGALLGGLSFAVVLVLGLRLLHRADDDRWILYGVTIALAPAVVLGSLRPDVVAVRYFLVGLAFWLLLLAFLLGRLARAGAAGRLAALAVLAIFVVGNAGHIAAFVEHGRGGYREALLFMARETEGPRVSVASDHDFRNGMVLNFYRRVLPPDKTLVYHPRNRLPRGGAEWRVVHAPARPPRTPARISDGAGHGYALAAEFDHAAISGFYWAVYRRESGAPRSRITTPKP